MLRFRTKGNPRHLPNRGGVSHASGSWAMLNTYWSQEGSEVNRLFWFRDEDDFDDNWDDEDDWSDDEDFDEDW